MKFSCHHTITWLRATFYTIIFFQIKVLCAANGYSNETSVEHIHDLGVQSINGDGIPIDLEKGRYYIHQSALRGYPLGQYHLGILFYTGEGGQQNTACAQWWLEQAQRTNGEIRDMARVAIMDIQQETRALEPLSPKIHRPMDEQSCLQLHSIPDSPAIPELPLNTIDVVNKVPSSVLAPITAMLQHSYHWSKDVFAHLLTVRERKSILAQTNEITPLLEPTLFTQAHTQIDAPAEVPIMAKITAPKVSKSSRANNLGGNLRHASENHFTLQISSASTPDGLYDTARRYKLSNYLVYETVRNGRPWYILVYGEYSNITSAKQDKNHLPAALQGNKPWVRKISQIHAEL